jgi:tetraacyldisaccharide 4'-kinase
MDEAALHELLSGRRRDAGARLLRGVLSVASLAYSTAMTLRNMAYDLRWFGVRRAGVPVISLGNITTGGTGKTPMAAWLANWLLAQGRRPGLLSRGYRSLRVGNECGDDGSQSSSLSSSSSGNDEKRVLDRLCPGVPHLQQRDRVDSARRLVGGFGCDVLILDDGFQHRRLHRDLDLVLVDALQPWGFGHVLPRGLLREPLSGLRRAGVVLITRSDQCALDEKQRLIAKLNEIRGTAECVEVAFTPRRLVGLDGAIEPLETANAGGAKALAFCGIGNPGGFRQTLASLNINIPNELRVFPDHHHYRAAELHDLAVAARVTDAEIVLTTLKDLVKIPRDLWTGPPLFAVEIGVEFPTGGDLLLNRLQRVITAG